MFTTILVVLGIFLALCLLGAAGEGTPGSRAAKTFKPYPEIKDMPIGCPNDDYDEED